MADERRQSQRANARLLTWYKVADTAHVYRALTKDVSAHGFCLVAETSLPPGTRLDIELQLPDCDPAITCTVEVMWNTPSQPDAVPSVHAPAMCQMGVRIMTIDPKAQALIKQYATMNAMPPLPS